MARVVALLPGAYFPDQHDDVDLHVAHCGHREAPADHVVGQEVGRHDAHPVARTRKGPKRTIAGKKKAR